MSTARIHDAEGRPLDLYAVDQAAEAVYETIRHGGFYEPDPSWLWRHGGHDHAWGEVDDQRWAVSHAHQESRHVDCDGECGNGCEGYEQRVWVCDIFRTVLRPGTRQGGPSESMLLRHTLVDLRVATTRPGASVPANLGGCTVRWDSESGLKVAALPDDMPRVDLNMEGASVAGATYQGRLYPT